MKYDIKTFISTIFVSALFVACADPELTEKLPRLEEYETADGKPVFKAPETPAWVNQREFETIEITAENKAEILKQGIKLYTDKDYDTAYPYLTAAAKGDQKVAHLYIALIMSKPGDLAYPRGVLSHHYKALDSGAHASSLLMLARSLAAGTVIENDDVGAAQYFARLDNAIKDKNHGLVKESRKFLKSVDKSILAAAEKRERDYLLSQGQSAKGGLGKLVALTKEVSKSSKAPGTEYLELK